MNEGQKSGENSTVKMRLEGKLWACDFGEFDMPIGAEIDNVSGWKGIYTVSFTDPIKYPDIEVHTEVDLETQRPETITVWDDEGEEHYYDY
jgi:hypothetical protein